MRTTVLDNLFQTCLANRKIMPLYAYLEQILQQVKPMCLVWNEPEPLQTPLPDSDMTWPHAGFCLDLRAGLAPGKHSLCVDQGYQSPDTRVWCERLLWNLEGLLLFQRDAQRFEVIPLAAWSKDRSVVLPEIQLAFKRTDGGWSWEKSTLGPVNAVFHDTYIDRMDAEGVAAVDDAVDTLGNAISLCLGTLYTKLTNPLTTYNVTLAKDAKVKRRGDKVVKIYRPATVGSLEIV